MAFVLDTPIHANGGYILDAPIYVPLPVTESRGGAGGGRRRKIPFGQEEQARPKELSFEADDELCLQAAAILIMEMM